MRVGQLAVISLLISFSLSVDLSAQDSAHSTGSGLDLNAIDKSADPCQDFYQYACGNWIKNNPIPSDQSRWSRFDELQERNLTVLKGILEDAQAHGTSSPIDAKIGAFYGSCMDEATVERLGSTPLESELERISHISNQSELLEEIVRLQQRQVPVFFDFGATPDLKDASKMIAGMDQGGLGLPERDYYLRTDDKSVELRQKYAALIAKLFELSGVSAPDAKSKATAVLAIETDLAKASLDITSRRDPQKIFHEMTPAEFAKMTPGFSFDKYFTQLGTPQLSVVEVTVPDFFKKFAQLVASRPLPELQDYLKWHYLNASAALLSKAFVDATFDFYGRTLAGTKELRPRWKRCVAKVDDELGEALGRKYVEKTFGEEGKQRTLEMVNQIEHQMANDINSLTWMSAATKQQALVKLHAVANKIGFPDKWIDYSPVNVVPNDYFGNFYRANEFEFKRQLNKISKPVDRSEWNMTPPTVNAYYNPLENNINFPAGILQPPFFSNTASDAVNYGAAGVVVGHELTHGFDDQGRKFDADGNLKDWWQNSDRTKFEALTNCLVNEYGGFSPIPGIELNGKLTLGENTADNGGIRLAYLALIDDLAKKSIPPSTKLDGYTQTQQFFLGFGQIWCENIRPEAARLHAQTDPHSPGRFRVNGVVSNMPQFGEAFGCKVGSKMEPAHGCRVW